MINSTVTGESREVAVDILDPQPIVDMFGDERTISQATLSFTGPVLKAVRLTATDGEEAFVDTPDLETPEKRFPWLGELIAEHRPSPFGAAQELAATLLAGLHAEATEHIAYADAGERTVLSRLTELEPAEALTKLDELDLLTGTLLRAARDVLRHLDRRTYESRTQPRG